MVDLEANNVGIAAAAQLGSTIAELLTSYYPECLVAKGGTHLKMSWIKRIPLSM